MLYVGVDAHKSAFEKVGRRRCRGVGLLTPRVSLEVLMKEEERTA